MTNGTETARLEGHSGGVSALCVLQDGRLASGSNDNTIRLWDLTTGGQVICLEGHLHVVRALCALPDGRLASGAGDKTVRLWDLPTGVEIARLETDAAVQCLIILSAACFVAGDDLGRLHWLQLVN